MCRFLKPKSIVCSQDVSSKDHDLDFDPPLSMGSAGAFSPVIGHLYKYLKLGGLDPDEAHQESGKLGKEPEELNVVDIFDTGGGTIIDLGKEKPKIPSLSKGGYQTEGKGNEKESPKLQSQEKGKEGREGEELLERSTRSLEGKDGTISGTDKTSEIHNADLGHYPLTPKAILTTPKMRLLETDKGSEGRNNEADYIPVSERTRTLKTTSKDSPDLHGKGKVMREEEKVEDVIVEGDSTLSSTSVTSRPEEDYFHTVTTDANDPLSGFESTVREPTPSSVTIQDKNLQQAFHLTTSVSSMTSSYPTMRDLTKTTPQPSTSKPLNQQPFTTQPLPPSATRVNIEPYASTLNQESLYATTQDAYFNTETSIKEQTDTKNDDHEANTSYLDKELRNASVVTEFPSSVEIASTHTFVSYVTHFLNSTAVYLNSGCPETGSVCAVTSLPTTA